MTVRLVLIILCLLLSTVSRADDGSVLQEAREQLSRGEAAAAYQMLLPLEARLSGTPQYDLLVAEAALESDRANIALFVLDRLAFAHPQLVEAQLLMAQAYIRLGTYLQAQQVLQKLLSRPRLDGRAHRRAVSLMLVVTARLHPTSLSGYLDIGVGHDSNANSATASTSFLGYDLSANSRATPSATESSALGVRYTYTQKSGSQWFSAVDWASNRFPDANFVDNDRLGVQLGWQKDGRYVVGLQAQTVNLDGVFNNRGDHLYALMRTETRLHWQPFLRVGRIGFDTASRKKEVSQAIIGTQFSLSDWIRGAGMSILLAEDTAILPDSPYGRRYAGWQLYQESHFPRRLSLHSKLGVLYSQYQGQFYGIDRGDRQTSLGMELKYRADREWELGLSTAWVDSWSSVALYQYERFTLGLNIRRTFVR